MSCVPIEMLNVCIAEHRSSITSIVEGGMAKGYPMPCPKHVAVDLATHACDEAMRILKENIERSVMAGGPGTEDIVCLLAMKTIYYNMGAIMSVVAEQMSAMRKGMETGR